MLTLIVGIILGFLLEIAGIFFIVSNAGEKEALLGSIGMILLAIAAWISFFFSAGNFIHHLTLGLAIGLSISLIIGIAGIVMYFVAMSKI